MNWFVYRHNFNDKRIEKFDVFLHYGFYNAVKRIKRERLTKEEFSARLKEEAMYFFWCKCEYEIVITSFPSYVSQTEFDRILRENNECEHKNGRSLYRTCVNLETEEKIDIYDQLTMNWDSFVDYVRMNDIE